MNLSVYQSKNSFCFLFKAQEIMVYSYFYHNARQIVQFCTPTRYTEYFFSACFSSNPKGSFIIDEQAPPQAWTFNYPLDRVITLKYIEIFMLKRQFCVHSKPYKVSHLSKGNHAPHLKYQKPNRKMPKSIFSLLRSRIDVQCVQLT